MFDTVKYNEELEYIFNQFPSYQQVGKVAYKPGIETMTDFDKQLGYPHKKYATIHIAGTNGKGSVSHMLASVLAQTGAKVGLYTSPHLNDFRERIKINGEMIPKSLSSTLFLNGNTTCWRKSPLSLRLPLQWHSNILQRRK